ncbi:MAG: mucoidy inhibitor MuiA family protein [Cyanobacteria bacterium P01_H01_bin.58]
MPNSDSPSSATCVSVNTQIVEVMVYPHQARVTRLGHIRVKKQTLMLEIQDLPATLQTDSIQAYPAGSAKVILQEPEIQTAVTATSADEHTQELSQQVQQLEIAFRACKDQLAVLNLQRTFLESLQEKSAVSFAEGLSQRAMGLEEVAGLLQFLEESYTKIAQEIAQQERLKQDLDHQLQAKRKQLQESQSPEPTPRYRILLPLTVEEPGTLELNLLYDVDQAHWAPLYEVRLNQALRDVQINYVAQVYQNTGEAWPNVALKFSTAAHLKEPTLPPMGVWHVDLSKTRIVTPEHTASHAANRRSRSDILEDTYRMLGAVPGSEIPADENDATTRQLNTHTKSAVVCFPALEPAVVPSGDRPERVKLCQLQIDTQLSYVALPQLCSAPYLQAQLANPLETWPLLAGTAHIFKDGGYIGREPIDYVAPGESFQLSLGLDERISLRRELIAKETQTANDCRDLQSYRLTLHNPLEHTITLNVIEQIPLSQTEKIQVNLVEAAPSTTASDAGFCQWSIALKPQETQHIQYQYAVEHPCDMPILGWDSQ